jgi:hypothetical protein
MLFLFAHLLHSTVTFQALKAAIGNRKRNMQTACFLNSGDFYRITFCKGILLFHVMARFHDSQLINFIKKIYDTSQPAFSHYNR